jgi:formate-dependent nitrite reductase cytochrome c552 subunit
MCAECHSTNLVKAYDPDTDTYDTTWSDVNVGCEACHGPGSAHVAWAEMPAMARPDLPMAGLVVDSRNLTGAELVERCAPCHSRRAELGDDDHTNSRLLDDYLPALLREGLYYADGQILDEVYVYGSFLQSKMYARDVTCRDCHDSHSLKLHADGNALCLQCHQAEVYDTRDHHFHKRGRGRRAPSDGALCVKCHMVESPYMVIDWRADHSFRVPRPDL